MNKQHFNKKSLIIALAVLAVLLAAAAIVYFTGGLQQPQEGAKALSIAIYHGDGSEKTVELKTDAEYLRGALEEQNLISGTESEFGLFIITVDGETADAAQQQWWCITKGGETVNFGVDAIVISNGESYELTLTTGY